MAIEARPLLMTPGMKAAFPTRSMMLLIGIGLIDLISTAWMYHAGLIYERNPLMRVLLVHGEWLFVVVKGATLFGAWIVMAKYAKQNLRFVQQSCLVGSAAYMLLWTTWFFAK
jgi:hypothetical protein